MIRNKFNSFVDWIDRVAWTDFGQARRTREHFAEISKENTDLKSRMKPKSDGQIGYFVEDTESDFLVLAVKIQKLATVANGQKDLGQLDKDRLYFCRRAFADNSGMMPMIRLKMHDDERIKIDDGNHRLEALSNMGEDTILVYVRQADVPDGKTLDGVAEVISEACGDGNKTVSEVDGKYVYCNIDYDRQGASMVPRLYEARYEGPYFKISD